MQEKEKSLCFTGHRPHKLANCGIEMGELEERVKAALKILLEEKIIGGVSNFYCGMANGSDIWCAQTVVELKNSYPHIRLIACIPHEGQEKAWSEEDKALYRRLVAAADEKKVFFKEYTPGCMQIRNRYMADNAAHMIAIYNGTDKGGTYSTIKYAQKLKRDILLIDLKKMSAYRI